MQQFESQVQECWEEAEKLDASNDREMLLGLVHLISKYGPEVVAAVVQRGDR
jgi:hypothetical protein